MAATADILVQRDAPIPTWFRIGGRAERFATPRDAGELRACLTIDPALRVLGDGANLLVDDDGVPELVVSLRDGFGRVEIDARTGRVVAGAGANLPKLVVETVRQGLGGLEGLGGVPATLGGAAVMNAGGAFGEIANAVTRVHGVTRAGEEVVRERRDIAFGYRASGLRELVLTAVELQLAPADPGVLRERLKDVMAKKKASQPMAEDSAGCCFKNPVLAEDLRDGRGEIGARGARVSAGLLIDRAGLKGLRIGGAEVSAVHANFVVTRPGAAARDVIGVMEEVEHRVLEKFGVRLEREVVVWRRDGGR